MPLEGDWQRAELARSVTLPILRWPNNRLQRTVLRAAAESAPLGVSRKVQMQEQRKIPRSALQMGLDVGVK